MKEFIVFISIFVGCTACTLSFQNIDTHGPATDLVDDTQTNTPTVNTKLKIPLPLAS